MHKETPISLVLYSQAVPSCPPSAGGGLKIIPSWRREKTARSRPWQGVDAFCVSVKDVREEPSFAVQQKVLQLATEHHTIGKPASPRREGTEHAIRQCARCELVL